MIIVQLPPEHENASWNIGHNARVKLLNYHLSAGTHIGHRHPHISNAGFKNNHNV
jgi:hypothetical protein